MARLRRRRRPRVTIRQLIRGLAPPGSGPAGAVAGADHVSRGVVRVTEVLGAGAGRASAGGRTRSGRAPTRLKTGSGSASCTVLAASARNRSATPDQV